MVKIKNIHFCVKDLKRKRTIIFWPSEVCLFVLFTYVLKHSFLSRLSEDLNPKFSVIFPSTIWIFMESGEPEVKSKQASKRDRTFYRTGTVLEEDTYFTIVILKWYTAYAKFRHKLCDFSRFPVARTSINILSASSKVRIFKQYSLWGVRRLGLAACYNARALWCISLWFCSKNLFNFGICSRS